MSRVGLFCRIQDGMKSVGEVMIPIEDASGSGTCTTEPDGILTQQQLKELCEQRRADPEARYGYVGQYEWHEIAETWISFTAAMSP